MRWAGVSCGGGWLAAAEAAVQIQAALEPGMDRIVPLDQGEDAGAARPLQGPEQHVIGIGRLATADEGLVLDDGPVGLERPADVVDPVRAARSAESREGKEGVRSLRSRWSPYHS